MPSRLSAPNLFGATIEKYIRARYGDGAFAFAYDNEVPSWQDLYFAPLTFYFIWWCAASHEQGCLSILILPPPSHCRIMYTVWLLGWGIHFPAKGYDTVNFRPQSPNHNRASPPTPLQVFEFNRRKLKIGQHSWFKHWSLWRQAATYMVRL